MSDRREHSQAEIAQEREASGSALNEPTLRFLPRHFEEGETLEEFRARIRFDGVVCGESTGCSADECPNNNCVLPLGHTGLHICGSGAEWAPWPLEVGDAARKARS